MIPLEDIRIGNYVTEAMYSGRPRALEPHYRVERDDLGYNPFLVPILIDHVWLENLGFDVEERVDKTSNYDWFCTGYGLRIKFLNGVMNILISNGGATRFLEHIKYVHQLQNLIYAIHNIEIMRCEDISINVGDRIYSCLRPLGHIYWDVLEINGDEVKFKYVRMYKPEPIITEEINSIEAIKESIFKGNKLQKISIEEQ